MTENEVFCKATELWELRRRARENYEFILKQQFGRFTKRGDHPVIEMNEKTFSARSKYLRVDKYVENEIRKLPGFKSVG